MTELLRTNHLSRRFGAMRAVDGVDLAVTAGSRHALIGPNGAGKSTLFRLVTGALHPSSGTVWFDGRDVTGTAEHRRARLGMSQTLQHSSLFPSMTVAQNVLLAAQRRWGHPWLPVPHRGPWHDRVGRLLSDVGLEDRAGDPMAALSYGECRQLEVAVALATEPRLLLLDEPAAGMSPDETARLSALLRRLPAETTLLFVEHDLDLVFDLATHVTALHLGRVLISGDPDRIRENELVQEAYLGAGARSDLFLEPIAESDDVSPGV